MSYVISLRFRGEMRSMVRKNSKNEGTIIKAMKQKWMNKLKRKGKLVVFLSTWIFCLCQARYLFNFNF